jgi:hypothetical protein
MEISFKQGVTVGLLRRGGVFVSGADVAQDRGVKTSIKPGRADVRVRTNPVVAWILSGLENERVALTSEDLDAVDGERFGVDSVCLDDRLKSSQRRGA